MALKQRKYGNISLQCSMVAQQLGAGLLFAICEVLHSGSKLLKPGFSASGRVVKFVLLWGKRKNIFFLSESAGFHRHSWPDWRSWCGRESGSSLQRQFRLCMAVTKQDEFQTSQTHTKEKERKGGREGGGRNKLNPVKLFFHCQWAWHRPLAHMRCEISCRRDKLKAGRFEMWENAWNLTQFQVKAALQSIKNQRLRGATCKSTVLVDISRSPLAWRDLCSALL